MEGGVGHPGDGATLPAPVPPLRRLRRLKGMTQRQLAEAAGVGIATVNRLERGLREARPGTMARIARSLGVKIADVDEFAEERGERRGGAGEPTD